MNKTTFSHYGSIIAVVIILAIMVAFATPFGDYVADSSNQLISSFTGKSNALLSEANSRNYKFRPLLVSRIVSATNQSGDPLTYDTLDMNSASLRSGLVAFTSGSVDELNVNNAQLLDVTVEGEYTSATITFDVGDLAREGDEIGVYHYNESTSSWEHIGNYIANSEREITATFASLSSVALINLTKDYTETQIFQSPTIVDISARAYFDMRLVTLDQKQLNEICPFDISDSNLPFEVSFRKVKNIRDNAEEIWNNTGDDNKYEVDGTHIARSEGFLTGDYYFVVKMDSCELYPNGLIGVSEIIHTDLREGIDFQTYRDGKFDDENQIYSDCEFINCEITAGEYVYCSFTNCTILGGNFREGNEFEKCVISSGSISYSSNISQTYINGGSFTCTPIESCLIADGEFVGTEINAQTIKNSKISGGTFNEYCEKTNCSNEPVPQLMYSDAKSNYNWIIMIDVAKARTEYEIDLPTEGFSNSSWYSLNNEKDSVYDLINETGDDLFVTTGYYYSTGSRIVGNYYCVTRENNIEGYPNGIIIISNIVCCYAETP